MRLLALVSAGLFVAATLSSCAPEVNSSAGSSTKARPPQVLGEGARAARSGSKLQNGWREIESGVEIKRLTWDDRGQKSSVVALRVAPNRLQVMVATRPADAVTWRQKSRALAIFNGGFFDENARSLGARLSNRTLLFKPLGSRWSVFRIKSVSRAGASVSEAGIVSARDFADALKRGVRYEQAVQCGPLLVQNGRVGSFKEQWARRTGLGIDAQGRVIVAAADSDLSLVGWARCFVSGLGCPNALNLDGGSSTQVSLEMGSEKLEWPGGRTVPDAIVIR